MWPRLHIDDIRSIVYTLGALMLVIALIMMGPLLVAIAAGESDVALDFLLAVAITTFLGVLMRMWRPRTKGLTRMQALVVTGLAWVTAGAVSCLPFVIGGYYTTFFDAFFDGVSWYTGTGMSLITDLNHLPVSLGLWRHLMLVIGAQGIVLVAVGLGTISKFSGASQLFEAEGHADRITPKLATTARFIALFMGAAIAMGTVVCTILCWALCGMEPLRALYHGFCIAAAAMATGGLSLMDIGMAYYHQGAIYVVLMILMLLGTFSFALYYRMGTRGGREFFKDIETRMLLFWAFVTLVMLAASFAADQAFGNMDIFIDKGMFNLVSALTGTGFCTISSAQLTCVASSAVLFTFIFGMAMGGATSSTAGGPKAIRFAIVLKSMASEVRRVLLPSRAHDVIRYDHQGSQMLTAELSRNAMLVLLLFLVTYILGALAGVLYGYDPLSAILESVSCTNNCGISAGICSADMPLGLKVVYLLQMLAGRLEFVTLLATLMAIAVTAAHGVESSRLASAVRRAVPVDIRRAWKGDDHVRGRYHDN